MTNLQNFGGGLQVHILAKALVLAVQHIAELEENEDEDHDIDILEQIASMLEGATEVERSILIATANDMNLPHWPAQIGLIQEE